VVTADSVLVSGKPRPLPSELRLVLEGPIPPHDFPNNGCTASPDYWRGLLLWVACWVHDWHYSGNVPEMSRMQADAIFRRNIYAILRAQGRGRVYSQSIALKYWSAVRVFGASSYKEPHALPAA
jgi:hypothetical protein